MPPLQTNPGIDCPLCGAANSTVFIALLPYVRGEGEDMLIVRPHEYSLCAGCYLSQHAEVYPDDDVPFTIVANNWTRFRNQARRILTARDGGEGATLDDKGRRALELLAGSEAADTVPVE